MVDSFEDVDHLKLPFEGPIDEQQWSDHQALVKGRGHISTIKTLESKGLTIARKKASEKQGSCFKYSPSFFLSWQSRWLTIKDSILRYYKTQRDGKMQQMGVLNFHLYAADMEMSGSPGE